MWKQNPCHQARQIENAHVQTSPAESLWYPTRQNAMLEGLQKADRNQTKGGQATLVVSPTRQIATLDGPLARQIAMLLESREDTELKLVRLQSLEVQVEN